MSTASAFSQSGVVHYSGNKFYFSFETQSVRQFVQNGGPDIFKERYVFYRGCSLQWETPGCVVKHSPCVRSSGPQEVKHFAPRGKLTLFNLCQSDSVESFGLH